MQPSKVFMTIYQETIQLAQLAQINNFQECTYNTDKLMASFSKIFIGTENHRFRASSSRGVEGWILATMVGKENFEILG